MNNSDVKFEELNFNGFLIQLTQSAGFDMMINATEMARPFGINKQPAFWLRSREAKNYINAFQQSVLQNPQNTLKPVVTITGNYSDGTRQGTWMHRWIALEFARWLSPEFALWCNQKIDELLQNGFTTALQEERDRYNQLLQGVQPKIDYYDDVLKYSDKLYTTEQICKDLGLGFNSKALLKKLEENRFIYRRPGSSYWYLSNPYDQFGYTRVTSEVIIGKDGKKRIVNKKRWTESGKHWIWSLKSKL